MLDPRFAYLAAIIDFFGVAGYAVDTYQGKTKPNRVTWFLWALAPLIAFTAQLSEGVTYQSALTFVSGFGPAIIFAVSFRDKQAYWRITKFDLLCGVLSLVALILWLLTRVGTLAIALSVIADALAATPTIIKSYRHPETESANAFLAGIIASVITLLTIKTWTFANYGFALYVFVLCATIYTLVKFPSLRFSRPAS
jgi:hypothetical protein